MIDVLGHPPAKVGKSIFWKGKWIVVLHHDDWLWRWTYAELKEPPNGSGKS